MNGRSRVRWSFRLLRVWARVAVHVFYRRIEVEGIDHVADERPAILAASHSNALGDVALIVAVTPRFPHFLAASSWWKRRYARVLFRAGGVLPLQRAADIAGRPDNRETFSASIDALRAGDQIAMFPTGEMHDDPHGQRLKTGVARIGLGAADAGVPDVAIIPVGMVYESRGRFRSDTAVRFGRPIPLAEWLAGYRADNAETVRALTQRLADELDALTDRLPRASFDRSVRPSAARRAALAPLAAVGALVNAPALLFGRLASRVCAEGWQATVKAVAGTALGPIAWAAEVAYLNRGPRRRPVLAVLAVLAGSGAALLAWVDENRDVLVRAASPRANVAAPGS